MVRPKKYFTQEEKNKAMRRSRNKYMLKTKWICSFCDNRSYTLAGKWSHINTNKHKKNALNDIKK